MKMFYVIYCDLSFIYIWIFFVGTILDENPHIKQATDKLLTENKGKVRFYHSFHISLSDVCVNV